jgi:hypothetical protein
MRLSVQQCGCVMRIPELFAGATVRCFPSLRPAASPTNNVIISCAIRRSRIVGRSLDVQYSIDAQFTFRIFWQMPILTVTDSAITPRLSIYAADWACR